MIDVSEYMWKLEMLRIWINSQIDFSTVFYDIMRVYEKTGIIYSLQYNQDTFEDFLHYASFNYKPLTV